MEFGLSLAVLVGPYSLVDPTVCVDVFVNYLHEYDNYNLIKSLNTAESILVVI
jgi:hypothetical protein